MPTPPEEVYRHSRSWFLTEVAERLNRRLFRRRLLPSAKDNVGSNYLDGFEEGSVKWKDSREAIREMRDLSAAAGNPFTVLMMPDFTQAFDERYGLGKIHNAVASWGRELNIPVFDVLKLFRGEDHTKWLVPWDGHPNAEAHRRIAAFLVGKILEEPGFQPLAVQARVIASVNTSTDCAPETPYRPPRTKKGTPFAPSRLACWCSATTASSYWRPFKSSSTPCSPASLPSVASDAWSNSDRFSVKCARKRRSMTASWMPCSRPRCTRR